jgi:hypothetical protein
VATTTITAIAICTSLVFGIVAVIAALIATGESSFYLPVERRKRIAAGVTVVSSIITVASISYGVLTVPSPLPPQFSFVRIVIVLAAILAFAWLSITSVQAVRRV